VRHEGTGHARPPPPPGAPGAWRRPRRPSQSPAACPAAARGAGAGPAPPAGSPGAAHSAPVSPGPRSGLRKEPCSQPLAAAREENGHATALHRKSRSLVALTADIRGNVLDEVCRLQLDNAGAVCGRCCRLARALCRLRSHGRRSRSRGSRARSAKLWLLLAYLCTRSKCWGRGCQLFGAAVHVGSACASRCYIFQDITGNCQFGGRLWSLERDAPGRSLACDLPKII